MKNSDRGNVPLKFPNGSTIFAVNSRMQFRRFVRISGLVNYSVDNINDDIDDFRV